MIVFISCVKTKRKERCAARDMYISPLFKKQLAYAQSLHPKSIYILSAKYGIIELDEIIEPYQMTVNDMPDETRKMWALHCYKQLRDKGVDFNSRAVFLCGKNYHGYLSRFFPNAETPLEGLSFGRRLQFLNRKLKGCDRA